LPPKSDRIAPIGTAVGAPGPVRNAAGLRDNAGVLPDRPERRLETVRQHAAQRGRCCPT
jgi:hypothetical protein